MKTIAETINELKAMGFYTDNRMYLNCPEASNFFKECLSAFDMVMLPEYTKIVDWMTKNDGKGIIMYGSNGRGKTLIAQKILPLYFYQFYGKILTLYEGLEMNEKVNEILTKKLLCIDDFGQEDVRNNYGEKSLPFLEIMDVAEKRGNLVILTTNLDPAWIEKKYGIKTRERIRACCTPVVFRGDSLRK